MNKRKRPLTPREEIVALIKTARISLEMLSKKSDIPYPYLKGFIDEGYDDDISIDDLLKIRTVLTEIIRSAIVSAPPPCNQPIKYEPYNLAQFFCKCKLTKDEIQACKDKGWPDSELASGVKYGMMSYSEAAQRIRKMLADPEHQPKE
jgi:hypothetical protein